MKKFFDVILYLVFILFLIIVGIIKISTTIIAGALILEALKRM